LTAQTEKPCAPVWVIVDEVASLEVLPNLPLALAESRKSNTRLVLGLQGRSQIEMRYGREAEAMLSQPRTKVFLRTSEPRGADWISKCIGEVEMEHLREGRTSGDWGFYYSRNASLDSRIEAAILTSEISNLEDLQGYFQTPGYTLKLRFPYTPAINNQPAFIRGDVQDVYLTGGKSGDGSGQEELSLKDKTEQQDPDVVRHPELKDGDSTRKSGETQGLLEIS
jgi:Type IV secretion-system coupling protein DNA-binding domain